MNKREIMVAIITAEIGIDRGRYTFSGNEEIQQQCANNAVKSAALIADAIIAATPEDRPKYCLGD